MEVVLAEYAPGGALPPQVAGDPRAVVVMNDRAAARARAMAIDAARPRVRGRA